MLRVGAFAFVLRFAVVSTGNVATDEACATSNCAVRVNASLSRTVAKDGVLLQMHRDSASTKGVNPCSSCSTCVADPSPTTGWPTTDGTCAACANGGQTWWPCNTALCQCGDTSPTLPTLMPTQSPSPPLPPSPSSPECGKCTGDGNCLFGNGVCYAMADEGTCKQWSANLWCGGGSQPSPPSPTAAPSAPPTPTPTSPTPTPSSTTAVPTPLPPSPTSAPSAPPNPTQSPTTPTPIPTNAAPTPSPSSHVGSQKMITFLENWKSCPSDAQIANYDEVMISFAVTYTWSATKNICDTNCDLKPLLICENSADWDKVRTWQAAGTKVLVSLGGAGMGGSWVGAVNDCWEHCLDKVDHLVNQMKELVTDHNLDGVDVDYEYHTEQRVYQDFLKDLTVKLKTEMPDKTLTHTPLDWHIDENDGYYNVLKEVGQHIDLLMPQYYNGYIQPTLSGVSTGLVPHYSKLVQEVYGGDASRVLHGFCINDCPNFNVDGQQALQNFKKLQESFPDAGGVFFWAASEDVGNSWSKYLLADWHGEESLNDEEDLSGNGDCSGGCCQCTASGSCYVAGWGSPCFVPEDGQTSCAQFNGEWCG